MGELEHGEPMPKIATGLASQVYCKRVLEEAPSWFFTLTLEGRIKRRISIIMKSQHEEIYMIGMNSELRRSNYDGSFAIT